MINVQCRYGETCKKPICDFVHPGDPRWANARIADSRKPERDRRGPPARKSSGSSLGTSTNITPVNENAKKWGRRDTHSAENPWNFEQKESPAPKVVSTERGWNSFDSFKDSAVASSPAPAASGWGTGNASSGWDEQGEDAGGWGTVNASNQGSGWDEQGGNAGGWGNTANSLGASSSRWGEPDIAKPDNDPAPVNSKSSVSSSWVSDKKSNSSGTPTRLNPPSPSWGNTAPVKPVSPRVPDWSSVTIDASSSGNTMNRRGSSGGWSSISEGPGRTDAKGKGKAKVADSDVRMRDLSPILMPPPPPPPVSASSLASNRRPPPPLSLDTMPYVSQSVDSPLYAPSSAKSPAIPTKLPTRLQPSSSSLTSVAQKMAMAAMRNKSSSKPPNQKKKRSRHELYLSNLRHMQNAVILHIELRKAQAEDDHWKKTQVSSIYGHATQATRKMLNDQRSQYSQRLLSIKEDLKREIFALSHFPDFSAPIPAPGDLLTKEMVAEYTQELKLWFQDLELHKRLLADEEPEMANPDEVDGSSDLIADGTISSTQPQLDTPIETSDNSGRRPSDLAQRKKWTWKDLLKAAEVVEQRLSDTEAEFFFNTFTNISTCADDQLTDLTTQLSIDEEVQELNVETRDINAISAIIQRGGKTLSSQALELTSLLARVDELQKELDQTTLERKYFDTVNEQAATYFQDFEQWKEQDKARIAELTTQIRDLHLLRKRKQPVPPPPPENVTTLPPSISMNVLLDYIKPIITNMMTSEIEVALSGLRSRCIENQHRLKEDLLEEANTISRQAELVRARARELKSMSLPGINVVAQGLLPGPTPLQPSH